MTSASRSDVDPVQLVTVGPAALLPGHGQPPTPAQCRLALLETITQVCALEDVDQAFGELAEWLRQWLGVEQVALGAANPRGQCSPRESHLWHAGFQPPSQGHTCH